MAGLNQAIFGFLLRLFQKKKSKFVELPKEIEDPIISVMKKTEWATLKIGDSFLLPSESCENEGEFAGMPVKILNICTGNCLPGYFHFFLKYPNGGERPAYIAPWCPYIRVEIKQ